MTVEVNLGVNREGISVTLYRFTDGSWYVLDETWFTWAELIESEDAWVAFTQIVQHDLKTKDIILDDSGKGVPASGWGQSDD